MSKSTTIHPIPPPQPRLIAFVQLATLFGLAYLIIQVAKLEKRLNNVKINSR